MGRWQASRLSPVLVILFLHNAVGFFSHQLQGHLSRPRSRGCTLQMKASAEPSREELKKSAISEGVEEILASRALEASERAVKTWEMQTVDFCRPPEVAILQRVLGRMSDLKIVSEGGYPQAERTRLFFFRDQEYVEPDVEEMRGQLQAVKIEGNFVFDKASHRDFLGAILGTGIVREKVGDIILQGERGAQVMVVPEIAEYLCGSLKAVRSVPVTVAPIPLADLAVRPPVTKEVSSVEASTRLDAVASAGMGMSRSKLKDMVEGGDVLVNWKEATNAAASLKAGDLVTVRGKGRLEVVSIEVTAKERYRVKMIKYV